MRNEVYDVCYTLERNQAVYQYKNSDGSYRNYPLDTPQISCSLDNKYLIHCNTSPGMTIVVFDVPEDIEVSFNLKILEHSLALTFFLTGDIVFVHNPDTEMERSTSYSSENQLHIVKSAKGEARAFKRAGSPFRMICIKFSITMLKMFLSESSLSVKSEYKNMLDNEYEDEISIMTPFPLKCLPLLEQIINNQFKTPLDKISLTAKTNELFSATMSDFILEKRCSKKCSMCKKDLDHLIKARNILLDKLNNPPQLKKLAKLVGTNEVKLKIGFKEIFGTTVYGFVMKERMNWAKMLLESGRCNVSEAAWTIGYTNVSHFITCFTKHFAVTPGKFMRDSRQAEIYNISQSSQSN